MNKLKNWIIKSAARTYTAIAFLWICIILFMLLIAYGSFSIMYKLHNYAHETLVNTQQEDK